ncbi:hypothetical protein D3C86_1305810 [compost metagenome]
MFQFLASEYVLHLQQSLFSEDQGRNICSAQRISAKQFLHTLQEAVDYLGPGMCRLWPELSPLMAQQCRQYGQTFVQAADPCQMAARQGIPGAGLQLHTVDFKQGERQFFHLLPVDVRPGRMRQLTHLVAQCHKLRQ